MRKAGALHAAAASSFNGAAYSRSDSNPRSAVAVARDSIERHATHHDQGHRDRDLQRSRHAMNACPRGTRRRRHRPSGQEMITGRLKRVAGKNPNTRLVTRQSPTQIAMMDRSTLSASCNLNRDGLPDQPGQHRGNVEKHKRSREPLQDPPARSLRTKDAGPAVPGSRRSPGEWTVPAHASRCEPASCRRYSGTRPEAPFRSGSARRPKDRELGTIEAAESVVRLDDARLELVRRRILFGQLRCDGGNRRARLRNADSGRQPAVDVHPLVAPVETSVVVASARRSGCRSSGTKSCSSLKTEVPLELIRCDADHDMWNAIQGQRFPDDVRIGAQPVLPEVVSQNHDGLRRCASSVFSSNPGPRASATPIVLK